MRERKKSYVSTDVSIGNTDASVGGFVTFVSLIAYLAGEKSDELALRTP